MTVVAVALPLFLAVTTREIVAVWLSVPLVPVTVTLNVPVGAVAAAVNVSALVEVAGAHGRLGGGLAGGGQGG